MYEMLKVTVKSEKKFLLLDDRLESISILFFRLIDYAYWSRLNFYRDNRLSNFQNLLRQVCWLIVAPNRSNIHFIYYQSTDTILWTVQSAAFWSSLLE